MEELILQADMFVNNKYAYTFGNGKTALFTIVDEEFMGNNRIGRINRITCIITAQTGEASLSHLIIGIGDGAAGVKTNDDSLRGKALTRENMDRCVVELYG